MPKSLLILVVVSILAIFALACGGSASSDSNTDSTSESSAPAPTVQNTAPPLDDGSLHVATDGELLAFTPELLEVTAGEEVTVTFTNKAVTNKHTWVLVTPGSSTRNDVAAAGIAAGSENGYVKPDDPYVIAKIGLISGGASGKVTFIAPEAGTYQYVCTFPGHDRQMWGKLIVSN